VIRLEQVRKSFDAGDTYAVDRIDLEIESGELLVLLGESGCGKTTTLKMINRLIEPTSGRIFVGDEDTSHGNPVQLRRRIGYVFQGIGLFPHLTVAQNITVVPELLGWKKQDIDTRAEELLDMVGLPAAEFRHRWPNSLSGGQRQRVGLARALAARPRIMLMDEPFGALDPLTRDNLHNEFREIHRQLELTTVIVTHDMTEALLLADRIAVMNAGRIVACATPRTMMSEPPHEYARQLMEMPRRQADAIESLIRHTPNGSTGETAP